MLCDCVNWIGPAAKWPTKGMDMCKLIIILLCYVFVAIFAIVGVATDYWLTGHITVNVAPQHPSLQRPLGCLRRYRQLWIICWSIQIKGMYQIM